MFFASLTVLPIVMFLAGFLLPREPLQVGAMKLHAPDRSLREMVGVAGITGTIALLGFARPPWVQRLYFLLPLFLYFFLLLWRFNL